MNTCYCCQVKSYNACFSNIVEIKRLYSFAQCQIETFKWMLQGARQFSYADWVVPTSLIDKATNSAFIMLLTVWPSSREPILYPDKQGPKFLVCFLLYEVSLSKTVTPYKQQSCVLWLNLHSLCISNILLCVKQHFFFVAVDLFFPEYDLEPCQDPGTPRFGWHTGSRFGIGDSVAFSCNTGYRLQGVREIVCLGGGRRMWSAPLPRCVGTWSAVFITFSFLYAFCTILVRQLLNVFSTERNFLEVRLE